MKTVSCSVVSFQGWAYFSELTRRTDRTERIFMSSELGTSGTIRGRIIRGRTGLHPCGDVTGCSECPSSLLKSFQILYIFFRTYAGRIIPPLFDHRRSQLGRRPQLLLRIRNTRASTNISCLCGSRLQIRPPGAIFFVSHPQQSRANAGLLSN
jgi:hypothetical protein